MSVVRLVTQILPHSYEEPPVPPPMQGTPIFSESCGVWPEVQAETTILRCEEGGDNCSWEGLTELRKSRLRLTSSEKPPPPLIRVRPHPGGVMISVPLRIPRSDLQPKNLTPDKKFRCGTCGKLYKSRKPFQTHVKEHDAGRLKNYKCELCKQSFRNAGLYSAHCEQHRSQQGVQTIQYAMENGTLVQSDSLTPSGLS